MLDPVPHKTDADPKHWEQGPSKRESVLLSEIKNSKELKSRSPFTRQLFRETVPLSTGTFSN
jgi:hypothetical protein